MNEEIRRALCVDLAEADSLVAELQALLETYKANTAPDWGHVGDVRHYNQLLRELLGREG